MNQECQDVADQQTFAEGDPQHLVFAQTKALPDPLDDRLMPPRCSLTQPASGAPSLPLVWLLVVFPKLLESCHHAGSGYNL